MNKEKSDCLLTVIIPFLNEGKEVEATIRSLKEHTQIPFEIILINDASTDGFDYKSVAMRYNCIFREHHQREGVAKSRDEGVLMAKTPYILLLDAHMRIYQNDWQERIIEHLTHVEKDEHDFVSSLNSALSYCAGKYIIRVDVDDYSYRNRLQEQITFLESNPDITICASYMEKMDSGTLMANQISGYIKNFLEILLLGNPIAHPTVAIRKDFLYRNNLVYKHNFPFAEDYQLWVDIAKCGGSGYILPIPLVQYRISETQVSFINVKQQEQSAYMIKRDLLNYFFETNPQIKTTLQAYLNAMQGMVEIGAMTTNEIFEIFYAVFIRLKLNKENS